MRVHEVFLWIIPVFVAGATFVLSEKRALDVIGACIALLLLVFMLHRPGGTLIALVIFLPFEGILFSLLYGWHVPGSFLREASAIKELMGVALLLSGLRELRDSGKRLDRIDIALLLYVGVTTIYLIAPHLFSELAPTQLSPRLLAYRSDVGYVLIFFGVRHAPISPKVRKQFLDTLLVVGGILAVVGIYQKLDPAAFSNFVLNTAHQVTYQTNVLGTPIDVVYQNLLQLFDPTNPPVSSLLFSSYDLADYLLVVSVIAAVRISRNPRTPFHYIILAVCMASIYFTQVRGDAIAALIVLVIIALPTAKSPVEGRLRLGAVLLVAAIFVVPALGHSRFFNNAKAAQSSQGHIYEIDDGIGIIYYEPLGLGLGQQPGVANRYPNLAKLVNDGDISDNMITQVGDELGLQALIPWLAMLGFTLVAIKRRASGGDQTAAAMGFALLGIVMAGQTHHVFLTFPGPWTLWAGVGLGLSTYGSGPFDELDLPANSQPSVAGVR
jgi:O-antigen ligase/polysaccharide polymerase Wzy-like membrane protein